MAALQLEESLTLSIAPAALWPWISTPERLAQWIPDAQSFEAQPPGPLAAGSKLIVHPPRGGAPVEARVERVEAPHALVLHATGLPNDLEVRVSFLVREQGSGCVLTLRAESKLSGMMIFAEKLIVSKARPKLRGWLDGLGGLVGRS